MATQAFTKKRVITHAFIGLADQDGEAITLGAVIDRLPVDTKSDLGYGSYTNDAHVTYTEGSLRVETDDTTRILEVLEATNQECALIGDSFGDYYFLYPGKVVPAGKMVILTALPTSGDFSVFNGLYYQLVSATK